MRNRFWARLVLSLVLSLALAPVAARAEEVDAELVAGQAPLESCADEGVAADPGDVLAVDASEDEGAAGEVIPDEEGAPGNEAGELLADAQAVLDADDDASEGLDGEADPDDLADPSEEEPTGWVLVDGEVRYVDPETGEVAAGCELEVEGLCAPLAAEGSSLSDVTDETPHEADIEWLFESGISTGWVASDGTRTFRPANTIIRQDMAAFLYRLAGSPDYTPTDEDAARFTDVTATTPHALEIWWLASTGISTGWSDGTFRPTNTVIRQDMAAFLHRLACGDDDYVATEEEMARFADVDETTPHANDIWWLASTGVSMGWETADGTTEFRPTSRVVRQDMAAFLHRMVSLEVYEPTATHSYLLADDGSVVTGWVEVGGERRYYSPSNGALVTSGWIKEDADTWRYIDPATKELLTDGLFVICGATYCFDADGVALRGWVELDDGLRFFDRSSRVMLAGGVFLIDGEYHYLRSSGIEATHLTGEEALEFASCFIGSDASLFRAKYRELTGITMYGDWCCQFVSCVVVGWAGATIEGLPATWCPSARVAATRAGRQVSLEDARPGDVVYFEWTGNDNADHVGIFESYENGVLTTVDGNVSNTVAQRSRTARDWLKVWVVRPDYAEPEPDPQPDTPISDELVSSSHTS